MAYINTTTKQYPVSEQQIRDANPNTSFPMPFSAEGYEVVFPYPMPPVENPVLQTARETDPVLVDNDEREWYEQAWEIVDIYSDYTDADGNLVTKEQQETDAVDKYNKSKQDVNKRRASLLLSETDWVENPSVSDTTKNVYLVNYGDIMVYREALRLIAVNPPVNVDVWPEKPNNIWSINNTHTEEK